jgi:TPR repeat protein
MQSLTLAYKWYKRVEILINDGKGDRLSNQLLHLGFGLLYEYGNGVEQDYQRALGYYTKLVDDGLKVGMLRLGLMYYYRKGVRADYRKSFDLFQKSGHGLRGIGKRLPYVYNPNNLNGDDSQDDLVYCLMSEEEVAGEAHYYRGLQYKYGQGVPSNQHEAQYFFGRALSNGCKRAECELDDRH